MGIVALAADVFEDFIDGYFPLAVSLHHLLERRGYASAWVIIRVAPMMDIPDLPASSPVPLHLDPAHGGQIDWLAAAIRRSDGQAALSGVANWRWNDKERAAGSVLAGNVRLAEPAFVRGIGFKAGECDFRALGPVQESSDATGVAFGPVQAVADCSQEFPHFRSWELHERAQVQRLDAQMRTPSAEPGMMRKREALLLDPRSDPKLSRLVADLDAR